jgi:AcrR family transcriptional regulator
LGAHRRKHAYHHGDLRNALVGEALTLLEKEGSSGFTLRDLARRVGVSCAAPYAHFNDKEALMAAIAAEGFIKLKASMDAALDKDGDPLAPFMAVGRTYIQFGIDNPALYELMFASEDLPAKRHLFPDLEAAGTAAFTTLTNMLGSLQQAGLLRPGDLDADGLAVWAHVHGLVSLINTGRIGCVEDCGAGHAIQTDEAIEHSLGILLDALRAPQT